MHALTYCTFLCLWCTCADALDDEDMVILLTSLRNLKSLHLMEDVPCSFNTHTFSRASIREICAFGHATIKELHLTCFSYSSLPRHSYCPTHALGLSTIVGRPLGSDATQAIVDVLNAFPSVEMLNIHGGLCVCPRVFSLVSCFSLM